MHKLLRPAILAGLVLAGCAARPDQLITTVAFYSSTHPEMPEVFVNGLGTAFNGLTDALRRAKAADPLTIVRLMPDEGLTYRFFSPALISCAQAKITNYEIVAPDGTRVQATLPVVAKHSLGEPGISFVRPGTTNPANVQIILEIVDGKVYAAVGDQTVEVGSPLAKLLEGTGHDAGSWILIRPEAQVPVLALVSVCQTVKSAGFEDFAFAPVEYKGNVVVPVTPPSNVENDAQKKREALIKSDGWSGNDTVPATGPATGPAPTSAMFRGPRVQFLGANTARAVKVVYVVDRNVSMLDNFDLLRQELTRSINDLLPVQQFAVVTFSGTAEIVGPSTLLRATTVNKHEMMPKIEALRTEPSNDRTSLTACRDAFTKAFAMRPQAIIYVTDGSTGPALAAAIKDLNGDHKVAIDTFAFVNDQPAYTKDLEELAKENGGTYHFVSEKDLQQR